MSSEKQNTQRYELNPVEEAIRGFLSSNPTPTIEDAQVSAMRELLENPDLSAREFKPAEAMAAAKILLFGRGGAGGDESDDDKQKDED